MIIKDLLEELKKSDNTVAAIAKSIDGIGEKKLRIALRNAGYEFRNSGQTGWYYTAEQGAEPLERSIFEYISSSIDTSQVIQRKAKVIQTPEDVLPREETSNLYPIPPFSEEEIEVLKALAKDMLQERERFMLHKRIMEIGNDKRNKKTYSISKGVLKKFDAFAEEKKFNKSELLEVALLDLMCRYE
ncbi:hypothetical protein [Ectobacillus panaciterrae]|uniref:hypothetical protein n=1 Tax=Ectobacillus panaciterrae TaxID=363872 RepID=UPI00042971E3|nr:hypothetical protein [Ectobacillus panaciterrae]